MQCLIFGLNRPRYQPDIQRERVQGQRPDGDHTAYCRQAYP